MIATISEDQIERVVLAVLRKANSSSQGSLPEAPALLDAANALRSALLMLQPEIERQVLQRAEEMCEAIAEMWMLWPDDSHKGWVAGFDTGCEKCAGAVHSLMARCDP